MTTGDYTVLGLETSCDETAASVVRLKGGRAEVLSSVVHSQIDDHAAYGGVVPEIAARSHVEMIAEVTRRAMAGDKHMPPAPEAVKAMTDNL